MSIWKTLSALDCNEHVDKKGQFSYLSWTWAWAMVKERYPDACYKIEDDIIYTDGTMEVRCTVTIEALSHTMWLPVLDFKNKAIKEPNAFDINSSRMRVLVKCLAMFGLGHYIYAGESIPQQEPYTAHQKEVFDDLIAGDMALEFLEFMNSVGTETQTALHNSGEPRLKVALKKKCAELETKGHEILDELASEIGQQVMADDIHGLHMATETFIIGPYVKKALWGRLSIEEQTKLKSMKEQG
jgi:hypothetical protein